MDSNKVFIIAEAGVNHNGSLETAMQLIDAAAEARVDAVKFQLFRAEQLVSKHAIKAAYQLENTGNSTETQLEMIKKLELDAAAQKELMQYCEFKKVIFLSSAFDLDSVDELVSFGLSIFKIPSGEIENLPYLRKIGKLNKKVILSTGMSTLSEIEQALTILIHSGTSKEKITVLHCNTEYPTPMHDANLRAMLTIKDNFQVAVGYSDHTLGIEASIAAVALGAKVIEKHFTLNKNMQGPDHKASLEPNELSQLVDAIRNIEAALGNGIKIPSQSEIKNKLAARKSIVARKKILQGELFNEENLTIKRPGNGISPMSWDSILGQTAEKNYLEDDLI